MVSSHVCVWAAEMSRARARVCVCACVHVAGGSCGPCSAQLANLTGWVGPTLVGQLVPEPEPEPGPGTKRSGHNSQSGAMYDPLYDPAVNGFYPWIAKESMFYSSEWQFNGVNDSIFSNRTTLPVAANASGRRRALGEMIDWAAAPQDFHQQLLEGEESHIEMYE
jgi:hypothetical protein